MSSTFQVNDTTCGHCASTITKTLGLLDQKTKTLGLLDQKAKVNVDLATRRVEVSSPDADEAQAQDAIKEAGYTPVLVQPGAAATSQSKRGGCGCGCG